MDTSPGQERVISEAADALRSTMRGWHDDAERMRSDVARSIRGEAFDAAALEEAFARAEARMATIARRCAGRRRASTRRWTPASGPSWRISCPPAGAGDGEEERLMRRDVRIVLLTAGVLIGFGSGFHSLRMRTASGGWPGSGTWRGCAWTPPGAPRPPPALLPPDEAGR
jgi:hypothetical protein